ncbi:nucleotidyl transferase AbiEii/AbiGii toxin family protein, partial [Candidatus Saganbacteria bacterium]|nr:nucleotidyl transferase AbiEii/AbiGii toxin family protein [Candidatus Saganbacteria bacterium]
MAAELSSAIGISVEQVAREEWEMLILQELFASPVGNDIIFRGGTALRLCFSSPRFSDDLDFSELRAIPTDKFNGVIKAIDRKFPNITLSDLWSKRFTHLAEFKIREPWLPRPFKIKVEIRKGET